MVKFLLKLSISIMFSMLSFVDCVHHMELLEYYYLYTYFYFYIRVESVVRAVVAL